MGIAILFAACKTSDQNEPTKTLKLPISICLPTDEVQTALRVPRRSIGDPGETEMFLLPQHIYIFIVNKVGADTWKLWEKITIDDANTYWHKEYYTGNLMGSGDSIYRYTREIIKPLNPGDKFEGRIYVIASAESLTFDTPLTIGTSTETDVINLKFSTAGDAMQSNLQHIYATPYNYEVSGQYYGSFNSVEHNVPYVNLLLYHVAAKVDITWAVNDEKRPERSDESSKTTTVRLTDMQAQYLFNGNAYCFKPMRNEVAAKLASGYERVLITPTDEGLWWEGRSYFYTIPYIVTGNAGYFPLQMFMRTNGSTGAGYKPTLNLEIDTSSVFVPWLRADFNINQALTDGYSPTIEVGD